MAKEPGEMDSNQQRKSQYQKYPKKGALLYASGKVEILGKKEKQLTKGGCKV